MLSFSTELEKSSATIRKVSNPNEAQPQIRKTVMAIVEEPRLRDAPTNNFMEIMRLRPLCANQVPKRNAEPNTHIFLSSLKAIVDNEDL